MSGGGGEAGQSRRGGGGGGGGRGGGCRRSQREAKRRRRGRKGTGTTALHGRRRRHPPRRIFVVTKQKSCMLLLVVPHTHRRRVQPAHVLRQLPDYRAVHLACLLEPPLRSLQRSSLARLGRRRSNPQRAFGFQTAFRNCPCVFRVEFLEQGHVSFVHHTRVPFRCQKRVLACLQLPSQPCCRVRFFLRFAAPQVLCCFFAPQLGFASRHFLRKRLNLCLQRWHALLPAHTLPLRRLESTLKLSDGARTRLGRARRGHACRAPLKQPLPLFRVELDVRVLEDQTLLLGRLFACAELGAQSGNQCVGRLASACVVRERRLFSAPFRVLEGSRQFFHARALRRQGRRPCAGYFILQFQPFHKNENICCCDSQHRSNKHE
mmetsp:Transcript_24485/g.48855  ORF Transcript_24485/g.48855 Transcript_24485/m.48855 type:complete len:377 (-) Transcript_24485:208-1338(-)